MAAEPELITIEEAAQYLRVCEKTLYRWLRDGKIRAYRAGRAWRFRRVDLDGWLLAQQNPGEAVGEVSLGSLGDTDADTAEEGGVEEIAVDVPSVGARLAELRARNRERMMRGVGRDEIERWVKAGRKRLVAVE